MKCLNLTKEAVKIFGVNFSYNKKLEHEMNFQCHIVKTESILRLWRMSNLTTEGKVLVFKSLAVSKIVHLSLITMVLHAIINQLNNIPKKFIRNGEKSKNKTFITLKQLRRRWFERR